MSEEARAREVLFDLAVNRALSYALRVRSLPPPQQRWPAGGPPPAENHPEVVRLVRALEPWLLRTRFAYRARIETVAARLLTAPAAEVHWQGGPDGGWHPGPAPKP